MPKKPKRGPVVKTDWVVSWGKDVFNHGIAYNRRSMAKAAVEMYRSGRNPDRTFRVVERKWRVTDLRATPLKFFTPGSSCKMRCTSAA